MDFELRELERRASSGDIQARNLLYYRRFVIGELDPQHLYLTTEVSGPFALAYRVTYRPEFGRWEPDAEHDGFFWLKNSESLVLVYSEQVISITHDDFSISYEGEDGDLDAFIESYNHIDEDALVIRDPVIILTGLTQENLYHRYEYGKDEILEEEDTQGFQHQEITIAVKFPGESLQTITVYNMFDNIQALVHEPEAGLDPMEFYRPGVMPGRKTGYVDNQRLFDNVFMFVHEMPYGLEPNFDVYRPPMMDRNDPRVIAMLDRIEYVDPNIEQYFKPQVQTIVGPAVFATFREEWDDIDYSKLPWPWNEQALEEAEGGAGYPPQLELGGLSDDQLATVMEFVETGKLP